jgi:hypothetical protein
VSAHLVQDAMPVDSPRLLVADQIKDPIALPWWLHCLLKIDVNFAYKNYNID